MDAQFVKKFYRNCSLNFTVCCEISINSRRIITHFTRHVHKYYTKFIKNFCKILSYFSMFAVLLTNLYSICCYNDPQLTLIHNSKPAFEKIHQKLSDLEPKFTSINLPGPSGRRLLRNLCTNKTGDVVIAIFYE